MKEKNTVKYRDIKMLSYRQAQGPIVFFIGWECVTAGLGCDMFLAIVLFSLALICN